MTYDPMDESVKYHREFPSKENGWLDWNKKSEVWTLHWTYGNERFKCKYGSLAAVVRCMGGEVLPFPEELQDAPDWEVVLLWESPSL